MASSSKVLETLGNSWSPSRPTLLGLAPLGHQLATPPPDVQVQLPVVAPPPPPLGRQLVAPPPDVQGQLSVVARMPPAAPLPVVARMPPAAPQTPSIDMAGAFSRLASLVHWRRQGLISETEFSAAKWMLALF